MTLHRIKRTLYALSGYEWFISWRYLKAKRKEMFISFISVISISGVAVGVMALIIVLAVMSGLIGELRDKILGTNAHIMIFKRGGWMQEYQELGQQISQVPHVQGVSPFIFRQAMIQSDTYSTEVMVKGIDLRAEQRTTDLSTSIVDGSLELLDAADQPSVQGILLGYQLAQNLHVSVGDSVALISPMKDADSSWPLPKREVFHVTGIFNYGMYEYDSNMAYISLPAAQDYFQSAHIVTGLEVKVDDLFISKHVADNLQQTLGISFRVRDWSEMNRNLFAVFQLYKKAMFLLLTLIVIVACLNIASTLIMMVMEKNHDIAILKTMGASSWNIMKLFIIQGVIIGGIGTGLGCLLGVVICHVADTYRLIHIEGGVYYLNYLPFRIMPLDFTIVALASVAICFFSTLYPARQAARLDPAVVLRCE
ncbi:lipoprotein-releasing ABC transporter permease subunit [candidate division KSB3 bacterium]|uniref:Lipoprotein-releasing ABC transporter permease subunit n=1 Tax=candidate division KSB3 bacterium TaxID=2044937 RepID=A0A9D5Q6V1_9BACT|nr:lipoprotein-releasing ABC transporter permease subunit [candidate division KSB3 bacterium]MBD3325753.1 lipoprotein-releasing ABC transporter permease subunit [candidate division KSB3 bacterium]